MPRLVSCRWFECTVTYDLLGFSCPLRITDFTTNNCNTRCYLFKLMHSIVWEYKQEVNRHTIKAELHKFKIHSVTCFDPMRSLSS
jgi:hypothetical protein